MQAVSGPRRASRRPAVTSARPRPRVSVRPIWILRCASELESACTSRSRAMRVLVRLASIGYALPGGIIGLGLLYLTAALSFLLLRIGAATTSADGSAIGARCEDWSGR